MFGGFTYTVSIHDSKASLLCSGVLSVYDLVTSRLALFSETSILALFSYIGSCFQETSILALFSGDQYIGSCFQETSILALFSGDQYIGSVFRRPVYWLCFQETR